MKRQRPEDAPRFLGGVLVWALVLAGTMGRIALAKPIFPSPVFPVGNQPVYIAVGDVNGDGHLDLVVANFASANVSVLSGNGDGTFGAQARFWAGMAPNSIAVADFNGDGRPDLAVANDTYSYYYSGVSVLLGTGDGTIGDPTRLTAGSSPSSVTVGDFNGDGRPDLAVANGGSNDVSVLLGRGDGTFGDQTRFAAGSSPYSVAVGDFNGDGRQDLAVANAGVSPDFSGGVSVLLGKGNGTFGDPTRFAAGLYSYSVTVGDFNGDGRQDLAVANRFSGDVSLLLGNGDGTFGAQARFTVGVDPSSVAVGDFNGDGRQDLVVANQFSGDVSLLLGNGDGTFGAQTRFAAGNSPAFVAVGDLNGDGRPDLAVADARSNDVSVLLGKGDGTFGVQARFAAGSSPESVAVGDFNGDGHPDLAVANRDSNDVSVLLGNSDGTFGTQVRFGAGVGPVFVVVRDFNGDGQQDLAVANAYSDDVSVLLGKGDGTFGDQTRFSAGSSPRSVAVGDFNGDRRLDLAVANAGSNDVSVLLGRGDGTFGDQTPLAAGSSPESVAVVDFSGGGRLDLVVASFNANNVSLFLGRDDGTFVAEASFAVGQYPSSVAMWDFNADGLPDLAVANGGSFDISVLLGRYDERFGDQTRFAAGVDPVSVTVADFNADGRPDLAVANFDVNEVSVLLGSGGGTFGAQASFAAGSFPSSIAVGDFNGDGRQDLAVANSGSNDVSVLLNQGPYPNRPPVAVAKADARVECTSPAGATVALDGSASSDPDSTPGTNDDIRKFQWFESNGGYYQTSLGNGQVLAVTLALGTHVVTLKVTDSHGATSTAQVTVTVVDTTPPALVCPIAASAECSMAGGAVVGLMSTASDACSPTVSITNTRTGYGADASGFYSLGTTGVTFTATDPSGNTTTCTSSVQVRDTVPPSLTLTLSPTMLWPPNHRLVPVQAGWQVSDVCDPAAAVVLAAAISSEADDAPGSGDGNTVGDIEDASIGTPDTSVLLRAERSGDGPGRAYTLTYTAMDASGNTASALGLVTVPHDLGTGPEPVSLNLEGDSTPGMAHLYWNTVTEAEMYDVIQGNLSQVSAQNGILWLGSVHVLTSGQSGTSYSEGTSGALPPVGAAFFYLVQYREGLTASGWGTESSPWPAEPTSCDPGCPGEVIQTSIASSDPLRR